MSRWQYSSGLPPRPSGSPMLPSRGAARGRWCPCRGAAAVRPLQRRYGPAWLTAPSRRGAGGERARRAAPVLEAACAQAGFSYRRLEALEKVRAANLKWLAGYRHPRHQGRPGLSASVREAFARPLIEGTEAVGDPSEVIPAVFHALWHGQLFAPLDVPLNEWVLVSPGTGGADGHRGSAGGPGNEGGR
ncbi:TnsA-like heteromeric transposase endonuclease subunit [Streptomyces sp. NA02950]|uniref:TnsA-like heteromeric transposase endonuclease subunit n=1 Tax=Streptomyces sp. NA02950 TaxID=2742137 RepID=UPI0034CFE726